jgi:hypothetical protein
MAKLVFVYYSNILPIQRLQLIVPDGTDFELFDPEVQYPADTVFYYDLYGPGHEHIVKHLQQGYRVIFDAKNEHYVQWSMMYVLYSFLQHPGQGCFVVSGHAPNPLPGVKIIATPYWYWIMDQYDLAQHNVDQIRWQAAEHKKKFFMSLGQQRVERDYLFDNLGDLLNNSIHSYQPRGIELPDDWPETNRKQRYINPNWMHSTAFTLAAETFVDQSRTTGFSLTQQDHLFLTEKSYKPLAAQHPILSVATPGTVASIRSQGFETFPELFDESYDTITDWKQRVQKIISIVSEFDTNSVNQPSVLQKLQHNQNRFFDRSITKQLALTTIQQPMFEFING